MAFPLLGILQTVLGFGTGIIEKKQKLKEIELEGKTRIAVAQAEAEVARLNKMVDAEIDWDNQAVRQMSTSWKDEYLTLLLSAPMILAFLGPWGRTAVSEGFAAISTAPEWFKVSFLASLAASFGIRTLVNKFGFGKS
jgi:hypothetical protein